MNTREWLLLVLAFIQWGHYCDTAFPRSNRGDPGGGAIVQLFRWRYEVIARECEQFLAPKGYGGVEVGPITDHWVVPGIPPRWNEPYFPISYNILSRSGDEKSFKEMVQRCNKAGIKVDAVKYMWPEDLTKLFGHLDYLNCTMGFACETKPYVFQDFNNLETDGTIKPAEYLNIGSVTDYIYAYQVSQAFRMKTPLEKLQHLDLPLSHLKTTTDFNGQNVFVVNGGVRPISIFSLSKSNDDLSSTNSVVFLDNPNTQRSKDYRNSDILSYKEPELYKMAAASMLAWPHGHPRLMSSYIFKDAKQGPPTKPGTNNIARVEIRGNECTNGWVCEHRWRKIRHMVEFRNVVGDEPVTHFWAQGYSQMSFNRGKKGFIVFNVDRRKALQRQFQTGLAEGVYCDVMTGELRNNECRGQNVTVDSSGLVDINILPAADNHVIAIHAGAKIQKQ